MNHFIVIHKPEKPLNKLEEFMSKYITNNGDIPHSFTGSDPLSNAAKKGGNMRNCKREYTQKSMN